MQKIIGLDIGFHSIKLVGLKMTSKGAFLTHIGIKEIPRLSLRGAIAVARQSRSKPVDFLLRSEQAPQSLIRGKYGL
jgi:Tfp pilus assembly PilM family ATPase